MFNLVFYAFILQTAINCNKLYASEVGNLVTWFDNSNNTSANTSLSPPPKASTHGGTPERVRKQRGERSVQYVNLIDQLERPVNVRHQSPHPESQNSQLSSPTFLGFGRITSVTSLLSLATDQSWLSSTASVFRAKPDILKWNDPVESITKGLIENNASNAVNSLQEAETILSDINVSKPMEIVEKQLFQTFGGIITSTTGMIKIMESPAAKTLSLKYNSSRLLNIVRLYKEKVEKMASNMQAWKYYFVHLYSNFTINDSDNSDCQFSMSAKGLGGFLEDGPLPLDSIMVRSRASQSLHLSVEMVESMELNSSSESRYVRDIHDPLIPQILPGQGNGDKLLKDTDNTNIANKTLPQHYVNAVFLFSLEFDCVNYMFQRHFYQLMKGLFEYQTFVKKIIHDRREARVEENKHTNQNQHESPKMDQLDSFKVNNLNTSSPLNASVSIDIAITTPNQSISVLNLKTRGLANKFRKIVLESREMEDSLVEYYASDLYARKVVRFGQWIESMYTASIFYDEKEFESNKGNYGEYSMIKQKPNNITDWILYVVNTNLEFERQLKNRTILEQPQILCQFPKLSTH